MPRLGLRPCSGDGTLTDEGFGFVGPRYPYGAAICTDDAARRRTVTEPLGL